MKTRNKLLAATALALALADPVYADRTSVDKPELSRLRRMPAEEQPIERRIYGKLEEITKILLKDYIAEDQDDGKLRIVHKQIEIGDGERLHFYIFRKPNEDLDHYRLNMLSGKLEKLHYTVDISGSLKINGKITHLIITFEATRDLDMVYFIPLDKDTQNRTIDHRMLDRLAGAVKEHGFRLNDPQIVLLGENRVAVALVTLRKDVPKFRASKENNVIEADKIIVIYYYQNMGNFLDKKADLIKQYSMAKSDRQ